MPTARTRSNRSRQSRIQFDRKTSDDQRSSFRRRSCNRSSAIPMLAWEHRRRIQHNVGREESIDASKYEKSLGNRCAALGILGVRNQRLETLLDAPYARE